MDLGYLIQVRQVKGGEGGVREMNGMNMCLHMIVAVVETVEREGGARGCTMTCGSHVAAGHLKWSGLDRTSFIHLGQDGGLR